MTPEQLEEIPGIGPEMVERIQQAINAYYGQFEEPAGRSRGSLRRKLRTAGAAEAECRPLKNRAAKLNRVRP